MSWHDRCVTQIDQLLEENRPILEDGIEGILNKNTCDKSFMDLFTIAYNMVFYKHGDVLYSHLKKIITHHIEIKVRNKILKSFNNNFLKTINHAWEDHQICMTMIRDIVSYGEKTYVKQANVDNFYDLGIIIFRDQLINHEPIKNHLRDTLLDLVKRERNSECIDRMAFKNTSSMLVSLGFNSLDFYKDVFENIYFSQSTIHYNQMAQKCITELKSGSVYIKEVKCKINEEAEFVENCLHISTRDHIKSIVEKEMILNHMETIIEHERRGIFYLLKHEEFDDLAFIYRLFCELPGAISTLAVFILEFVKQEGEAIVKEEEEKKYGGFSFMKKIYDLKFKMDKIRSESLNNDIKIGDAIDNALVRILGLNSKSVEQLCLFADKKIKKGLVMMNEEDFEVLINRLMGLLTLIKDQDIFENFYWNTLARRLLSNRRQNHDRERYIISKLKAGLNDFQFASKLEGMINDFNSSKTDMLEFMEHVASNEVNLSNLDLNLIVLTAHRWPLSIEHYKIVLPDRVQNAYLEYKTFYEVYGSHSGRSLTLCPKYGTAFLDAYFYSSSSDDEDSDPAPRKYCLQVSTCQMCVLMLFKKRGDSFTFQEIKIETSIPEKDLVRTLQALTMVNQNILIKTPSEKEIKPSDTFSINESFTSKSCEIKIRQYTQIEEAENENKSAMVAVETDRKYVIDCAIIRIMKTRLRLSHSLLVAEVTAQLKARFYPSPCTIKVRIDELIRKEYLERDKKDRMVYIYIL